MLSHELTSSSVPAGSWVRVRLSVRVSVRVRVRVRMRVRVSVSVSVRLRVRVRARVRRGPAYRRAARRAPSACSPFTDMETMG